MRDGGKHQYSSLTFRVHVDVIQSHKSHTPRIINTKVDGHDAYATCDLLVPHPTKPDLWKVYGRADDLIMLSTGEKACFFQQGINFGPNLPFCRRILGH
jgi:hypothetical protein